MRLMRRQGNKLIENGDGRMEFEIPGELELILKYAPYSPYKIYNETNNTLGGDFIPKGLDLMLIGFQYLLTQVWKTTISGNSTEPPPFSLGVTRDQPIPSIGVPRHYLPPLSSVRIVFILNFYFST
jgi:hypothetical protein